MTVTSDNHSCLASEVMPHCCCQVCLESLARLAWSDDDVREGIASGGGIRAVVDVMALHADNDGIQCNSCLALMSLVRGEGEVCQSNQWHIAKAGALEAVTAAMRRFRYGYLSTCLLLGCSHEARHQQYGVECTPKF